MARILLSESDPGVRSLLEAVLVRDGHEALVLFGSREEELPHGDLLVAEPAYGEGLRHAQALRRRDPTLAIILVSILPPESEFLALEPATYLVKPFSVASLARAVRISLTSQVARRVRTSAH